MLDKLTSRVANYKRTVNIWGNLRRIKKERENVRGRRGTARRTGSKTGGKNGIVTGR